MKKRALVHDAASKWSRNALGFTDLEIIQGEHKHHNHNH